MADTYNIQAILEDLNEKEEMQADQHDGCYELIHKTIQAFAKLSDLSILNYKDLNLVYLTTVGTWSHGLDAKKRQLTKVILILKIRKSLLSFGMIFGIRLVRVSILIQIHHVRKSVRLVFLALDFIHLNATILSLHQNK